MTVVGWRLPPDPERAEPRRHPGAAHSVSTRQAWLVARFRSRRRGTSAWHARTGPDAFPSRLRLYTATHA